MGNCYCTHPDVNGCDGKNSDCTHKEKHQTLRQRLEGARKKAREAIFQFKDGKEETHR